MDYELDGLDTTGIVKLMMETDKDSKELKERLDRLQVRSMTRAYARVRNARNRKTIYQIQIAASVGTVQRVDTESPSAMYIATASHALSMRKFTET